MILLNRKKKGTFSIYEKGEFTSPYKAWRDAKPGEWGISDDGYIAQCLGEKVHGRLHIKEYPYASVPVRAKSLTFENRYLNKAYSFSEKSGAELEIGRRNTKRFIQMYVKMFMAGKVDWAILGQIYRPDQKKPALSAKRLLKNKWVKEMIDKQLSEELSLRGMDKGFYLDRISEAIDIARSKKDASNMLKAAEMIGDIINIKGQKLETTELLEFRMSKELTEVIFPEGVKAIDGPEATDHLQIKG